MKKLKYTDKEIIADIGSFDEEINNRALRHLYGQYYQMALKFVKYNKGTTEDASDVFQEALIAFFENIKNEKFRGDSSIKTYLYATIRNNWFAKLKKTKETQSIENLNIKDEVVTDNTQDINIILSELMNQIGESCKRILQFYYYENLSMRDIMKKMDFSSEQSAKTQKYKCMQKLLKFLENKPIYKDKLIELL